VQEFGGPVLWLVVFVVIALLFVRRRRRPPGSGAAGTVYDWLNEDKRNAVEVIVEERAAARDPEHRDGNLPELQAPRKTSEPEG
jgi:Sec-independent protein translocase protein TatA